VTVPRHLLVLGDSLAFHGPQRAERPTDPRLYPNVCASELGGDVGVDLLARLGWTARDAWWAITKDPVAWGVYLPRADGLLIGVGGMDHLPAVVPTWARESLPYLRPGAVRRAARSAYQRWHPPLVRVTGGVMRQLPQAATDRYLTRIVQGVRTWRPEIPVVLLGPSPHDGPVYPSQRHHPAAVTAGRAWAQAHDVAFVDLDPLVTPSLQDRSGNPDGMHWGWTAHDAVGRASAIALQSHGWI
jgi:diglucosylglycerate octanoyltransferase